MFSSNNPHVSSVSSCVSLCMKGWRILRSGRSQILSLCQYNGLQVKTELWDLEDLCFPLGEAEHHFPTKSLKWAALQRLWLSEPYSLSSNRAANQLYAELSLTFALHCCCKAGRTIQFFSVTANKAETRLSKRCGRFSWLLLLNPWL